MITLSHPFNILLAIEIDSIIYYCFKNTTEPKNDHKSVNRLREYILIIHNLAT